MKTTQEFKEYCEHLVKKHLWAEDSTPSDVIEKAVPWGERHWLDEEYVYMTVKRNDAPHMKDKHKTVHKTESYAAVLHKKYRRMFGEWKLENRDTISLQVIDWGDDVALAVANHNLILSSKWLNQWKLSELRQITNNGGTQ